MAIKNFLYLFLFLKTLSNKNYTLNTIKESLTLLKEDLKKVFKFSSLLFNGIYKEDKRPIKKIEKIIGYENELKKIDIIIKNFIEEYENKKFNSTNSEGIILYGPFGTGKTTIAIHMIEKFNLPFTIITSESISTSLTKLKNMLEEASKKTPHVIIFDEMEEIFYYRSDFNQELISFMDGLHDNSGVFIIGITNYIYQIPKSLLRNGRFSNLIEIPLPNKEDRKKIIEYYFKKYSILIDDKMLAYLVQKSEGKNNSDLREIGKYLAQNRISKNDNIYLNKEEFNTLLNEKENQKIKVHNNQNIDNIAFNDLCLHESAHAAIRFLFQQKNTSCYDFDMVTINGIDDSLGSSHNLIQEKIQSTTKEKLLNEIKILYAGRIAQEILGSGSIDTGASSDFLRANNIAKDIVLRYAMGKNHLIFDFPEGYLLDKNIIQYPEIIAEINNLLKEEYKKTKELISEYRSFITMIASALQEKKILYSEDLANIYKKFEKEKNLAPKLQVKNKTTHKKKKNVDQK